MNGSTTTGLALGTYLLLGPVVLAIVGVGVFFLYRFLKKRKALKAAKEAV